jgi:hypothetical protein
MDCIEEFKSFHLCLKKNPDHVERIMDDAHEVVSEEEEKKK